MDGLEVMEGGRKMKGETTFENAKVGDKVWWSDIGERGTVVEITNCTVHPLRVSFPGVCRPLGFSLKGYVVNPDHPLDQKQTLFWDEIEFEVPTRPKRRVRKKKIVWANIYEDESAIFHESEEDARGAAHDRAVATAVTFEAEYMVEE